MRLSECWLIHLIMTIFPETNHIDHNITLELLPIPDSELTDSNNSFNVIDIHSDYWGPERLNKVTCMRIGSAVSRVGSEAYLVIRDEVDGPSTVKLRQL